jgi:hypothetical protein
MGLVRQKGKEPEKVACPNCGEPIASIERLEEITLFCKEFWGQCCCGQKYHLQLSVADMLVLSFPEKQLDIVLRIDEKKKGPVDTPGAGGQTQESGSKNAG